MKNCREDSKLNWASQSTTDDINQGSLQRIADAAEKQAAAMEKMTIRYTELIENRDAWKECAERRNEVIKRLEYQIRGLRGQITKLKNSIK